jgi:hypothetical protein
MLEVASYSSTSRKHALAVSAREEFVEGVDQEQPMSRYESTRRKGSSQVFDDTSDYLPYQ